MKDFKEKIIEQEKKDRDLTKDAYLKIHSAVEKQAHLRGVEDGKGAAYEIVRYYKLEPATLPPEIDNEDERVDYILSAAGVKKRKILLEKDWFKHPSSPLLCRRGGEYVALLPKGMSGFIFNQDGKTLRVSKKNAGEFESEAYCFYRPMSMGKISLKEFILYIISCVEKKELIYGALITLAVVLGGLFLPELNRIIFNKIIPSGTKGDIAPIAALLLGISMAIALATMLKGLLFTRINAKVNEAVQSGVWSRMLSLPATFYKEYSSGEVLQNMEDLNQIASMLSSKTVDIILSTAVSFAYIGQISAISPQLIPVTIVVIFAMLGFSVMTSMLEAKQQEKISDKAAKLNGLVYQFFGSVAKLQTSGSRARAFAKWAEKYSEKSKLVYNPNPILMFSNAIYGAISMGSSIMIYIAVAKSNIPPADYIAFNIAFGAFVYALLQFHSIVRQVSLVFSKYKSGRSILDAVPENTVGIKKKVGGKIEVENVSFKYTAGGPLILDDMSLSINAGEYVAFVGATGCGKSTLMRILLGFERPLSGTVSYDNENLATFDLPALRRQIGVVLQNGTLFAGDIFTNITITAPWLTLDQAWEVAERAGVSDDILGMPMGMYTVVSEGGKSLSGGQRQRIMIARALANNPEIIMFDEATSALDNVTQGIVVESLNKMSCTRIVIAHRLSTIMGCDRIIVFDKGRVVEQGTYNQLMEKDGVFYQMAKRQQV